VLAASHTTELATRFGEDDLAGRLLAEADPKRGLDCGYDREKAELSNNINVCRRRDAPPSGASTPASGAAAAAGAPSRDHPYQSKNENRKSEMGPISQNLTRVRREEGDGERSMSEVRSEPCDGGVRASVRFGDENSCDEKCGDDKSTGFGDENSEGGNSEKGGSGEAGSGRPRKERVLTGAERTRRWRSRVSGGGMC